MYLGNKEMQCIFAVWCIVCDVFSTHHHLFYLFCLCMTFFLQHVLKFGHTPNLDKG